MYHRVKETKISSRKLTRHREYRFASAREWELMRADIDKGIPLGRALQISLTDADREKYRIKNRKTVWRFVKKYVMDNGLPYVVESFRADDMDHIVVRHAEEKKRRTA